MFLFAVALLAAEGSQARIDFTDLETECRYGRGQDVDINLRDRQLYFEGRFPVENPDASMSYTYSKSGGKIVLNIRSSRVSPPQVFVDTCLGLGVYRAHTPPLQSGVYTVVVEYNGQQVKKQVIEVR